MRIRLTSKGTAVAEIGKLELKKIYPDPENKDDFYYESDIDATLERVKKTKPDLKFDSSEIIDEVVAAKAKADYEASEIEKARAWREETDEGKLEMAYQEWWVDDKATKEAEIKAGLSKRQNDK